MVNNTTKEYSQNMHNRKAGRSAWDILKGIVLLFSLFLMACQSKAESQAVPTPETGVAGDAAHVAITQSGAVQRCSWAAIGARGPCV